MKEQHMGGIVKAPIGTCSFEVPCPLSPLTSDKFTIITLKISIIVTRRRKSCVAIAIWKQSRMEHSGNHNGDNQGE